MPFFSTNEGTFTDPTTGLSLKLEGQIGVDSSRQRATITAPDGSSAEFYFYRQGDTYFIEGHPPGQSFNTAQAQPEDPMDIPGETIDRATGYTDEGDGEAPPEAA